MIEGWKLGAMLGLGLVCIALPLGLMIFVNAKTHAPIKYAFMGALVFLVFALFLEQALHSLAIPLLGLKTKPLAFIVYGALAAGLFEEIPRFFVLKWMDKDHKLGLPDAFQYGVGHGGVEMAIIVGASSISNYYMAKRINLGGTQALLKGVPKAYHGQVEAAVQALVDMGASNFAYALLERCLALTFHVCLAMIAFMVVRGLIKKGGLLLMVLLHVIFDLPAMAFQVGSLTNPLLLYFFYGLFDLGLILWIKNKLRGHQDQVKRRPQVGRIRNWPPVVKDPFGRAGSPDRQ